MPKRIAILQSNYIPWKGYFDIIAGVDEFVIYDEVQYTKRDWRNRNRIKTPQGLKWLTIPVSGSHSYLVNEVEIADPDWNQIHWRTIRHIYGKAPHFEVFADTIEELYMQANYRMLSAINHHFLTGINQILGITTPLSWSTDYDPEGNKSERLISICKQANADVYVSGPTAKDYLDVHLFKDEGIAIQWMDYSGYKEYPQLCGDFDHAVTILDLLFNTGINARAYLKSTIGVEV
ncbi:WbqC family protein [Fodinibius sp. SL11]|uniref:WbqC family protein n=1 Tax=Fodinibius sp. SL11 TaxID=3425690 RepID=UPI003F882FFD